MGGTLSYLRGAGNNADGNGTYGQNGEESYEMTKLTPTITSKQESVQGHLYKQPIGYDPTISSNRWKLRFFILKKLGLFYYHVSFIRSFKLRDLNRAELGELCETNDGNSGYKILLQFKDGHLLTLATTSKSVATQWVNHLNSFLQTHTFALNLGLGSTKDNNENDNSYNQSRQNDNSYMQNDMQNDYISESKSEIFTSFVYVSERGTLKDFEKKYVILDFTRDHQEMIIQDMTLLGNFNLRQCHVSDVSHCDLPPVMEGGHCIKIVNRETGRILTLASPQESDIAAWKIHLEQACALTAQSTMCEQDINHISMVEFHNTLHTCFENGNKLRPQSIQPRPKDVKMSQTVKESHDVKMSPTVEESHDVKMSQDVKQVFFILSFDGGGIRGVIPCLLLERLMARFPNLLSHVSMVSGTSNGSLIAMALAFGHHPATIREMTELTSKSVFSEQAARYIVSAAKWSNRYLSVFCKETWQDLKMSDAYIPCLVPSFCLDPMKVEVFTSFSENAHEHLVSDVTMKSCAAPTFFPAWKSSVDGGVFAHCPADLAVVHAMNDLHIPLKNIVVLSFSTGHVKRSMKEDVTEEDAAANTHNYGYYQWASQLPSVIWEGMIEKSTLMCEKLLGERFFRIDPELPKYYPLDRPEVLPELHAVANEVDLTQAERWLSQFNF
jgi:patatin-like phospholipase/acyl hydrolase